MGARGGRTCIPAANMEAWRAPVAAAVKQKAAGLQADRSERAAQAGGAHTCSFPFPAPPVRQVLAVCRKGSGSVAFVAFHPGGGDKAWEEGDV